MLADEQHPVVVVEGERPRRRGSRSGRRRRCPGSPSGRVTSSCQTVIQGSRRRPGGCVGSTGRSRPRRGQVLVHGGIVARRGRPSSGRPDRDSAPMTQPDARLPDPDAPAGRRASRATTSRPAGASRIPARDGVELSANLWLPVPPTDRPEARFPADPRDDPVRQGQLAAQRGHRPGHLPRAARLRALPGRRPRDRARRAASRSTSTPRRETRDGYDAVEWLAAQPWCNGAVGHVGDQLRRVHLDPGGQAPAAAPAGDRPDPGDGRPLPDRRPLHRRLRDGQRAEPVRGQPGGDERDAARPRVPRRRLARRTGWRGWRRRRRGCSSGCASSTTGRTGGRARSRPTTTRSRRRSSTSAAGWTRTSMRRSGCRRVHARRRGRSSATGSTACPRRRPRARTSTSSTRWSGSSIAGSRASPTAPIDEPPLVWFEREYAEPEPFPASLPGRWRAAAAYPHPARASGANGRFAGGELPLVGRLVAGRAAARRESGRRRPLPPRATVGTRAALSWGAGGPPNGLARDLRPDEASGRPSRPRRWSSRGDPRRAGGRAPPRPCRRRSRRRWSA